MVVPTIFSMLEADGLTPPRSVLCLLRIAARSDDDTAVEWTQYIGDTTIIHLDLYSLSGKTSYRQISWSLEAARLDVLMIVSLWNLTGISAALLPLSE